MTIRCRLNKLLEEKNVTPKRLAEMTGLPLRRVLEYCDENIDTIFLSEVAAILEALESGLEAFFEVRDEDGAHEAASEGHYAGWDSHCEASEDGKHDWQKDFMSSNSVYMEFKCVACGCRTHLIW